MHSNDIARAIKSDSAGVQTLNLSKNKISDEGIGHIIKAICESSIDTLNLADNKITEKSIEVIVGTLKTNKTLKQMDLTGNGFGSRLLKNKLKNALTNMEVIV